MFRPPFRPSRVGAGVLAALCAVAITGCDKKSEASGPKARVENARTGPFSVRIQESGTLEALISVEIKSNVEGEILELNVEDGDVVEVGHVLAVIDPEQIDEEVAQAEANFNAAEAQLDQAKEQTIITKNGLDSQLVQEIESVRSAQAALEATQQATVTQTSQAETDLANSRDTLERDKIALNQAEIQLQQLGISLAQLLVSQESARVASENAQRELERNEDLFEKKYVSAKALEDAQDRAASSSASYENSQQNVESQRKSVESQTASIQAQNRVISSRETTLTFQEANLETLALSRAASERQSQANVTVAESRLRGTQETIDGRKRVAELSETSASASVLRNRSSLETALQRQGWTILTSPISGTVTALVVEQGEIVTSGRSAFSQSPPMMNVDDLSQMIVRVPVNEVDMGQMKEGHRAEITVQAYPRRKFQGHVRQIAPSGSSSDNVVRFEVEVEVVGSPKELLPGMTADVDIYVVDREDVLQVPIEAVNEEDSFGILVNLKPEERAKLSVGDDVKVETRMGKQVDARVQTVEEPVLLALRGQTRGWRAGPVEFSLVLAGGDSLTSLAGNITQTKSYYVEVSEGGAAPAGGEGGGGARGGQGGPGGPGGGRPGGGGGPAGGSAKRQPVEVGMKNEAFYEILSGITAGTPVIIQPPKRASGGFGR
ncbi:MAG: HlyD family efflux transporter periplasmic adaptor subunit [Candidatus Poribacteria bacterium]